ncbi:tRNA-dihydrouridine(16) synthase [Andreprevotia sp. IGB-42]|uniref:tRNA-dihydrouridine synthase n=1 Tax=Andreprevotia sp. IGB-42 TaxID=2497473 RepID=UPI00157E380B|nr:tRNA-dihydrouridine synthase [Andreprevotia sp. IGB-42]KAF0814148.1 tRNA-dihydrouridine(16) synthase [Andreprevotia sp. IGB-42]
MRIYLAPMEGLLDHVLRDMLTRLGGVDLCVTEFVRVSGTLLPNKVFYRIAPELLHGSRTPSGVPVRVQLLGSDPVCMAENAAKLAALAPLGIDLNFGCPAKTVNRHRGGAVLLDEPETVHAIVAAVRGAVPAHIPVTAKMRLGYTDRAKKLDCALAIEAAGAAELVVHARTKTDGYRPPAYWEELPAIRDAIHIPLIANGEIWNLVDLQRCQQVSGCNDIMLGRGMVAAPGLARAAKGQGDAGWAEIEPLLELFWYKVAPEVLPKHRAGRLKQWLAYLRKIYPEADALFQRCRTFTEPDEVQQLVFGSMDGAAAARHHSGYSQPVG